MKYITFIATIMAASVVCTQCTDNKIKNNPLTDTTWGTPFETPPFGRILPEHFMPAVLEQIEQAKAGVNAIVTNSDEPTFENTIEALEYNGAELSRTLGVFYNLNSAETNDSLQAIAVSLSPILTEYSNDISLNEKLFDRVRTVYNKRNELTLNDEQKMLLEDSYKGFVRSGANLDASEKEQYRAISGELATLSVQFDQNELAATNAFEMVITDTTELAGLPATLCEAAAAEATAKGKQGYLFTLHYPSYVPFLKYADSRDRRQQIWLAKSKLCATGDSTDNQAIVKRIAELRLQLATLLGYRTYADFALENRMAQSAEKVNSFLDELLNKSIDYARNDVKVIAEFAASQGFTEELMPWDFSYFDNKYVTQKYAVNDEMTRPYFSLDKAEVALFMLAGRLYGVTFTANSDIPVYHPDVKAYEVRDADGSFLAVLYCDYFPREGKNSGAWMNTFREASVTNGVEQRPIVVLVNNFTKPTATTPSLLSFDEFTTMLHEFGHGLHGIFGKGSYASQTGTNVYRDFVELPSQIMENWATEKEFLDLFAVHYQTGDKMPTELIEKLIDKKNHLAAYSNVRQLSFGLNDMAWHSIEEPVAATVEQFEKRANGRAQVLPTVDGAMMSPAFGHIFAGGYAAGYYSYKWAEVLEADAFNKFKKSGIFDRQTAESFRENILSKGGSRHPMELYVAFAGAEPTVEPLLRKMGLIK